MAYITKIRCGTLSVFINLFAAFSILGQARASPLDDWRNFYGIATRGIPANNVAYAKALGYRYINTYHNGLQYRDLPGAANLKFYMADPEGGTYTQSINLNTVTSAMQAQLEPIVAWKSLDPWPNNIATGWFTPGTNCREFGVQLDFQQQAVIDSTINQIMNYAHMSENAGVNFRFAGLTWDVPNLTGDFNTCNSDGSSNQVSLAVWTGSDSSVLHPGITHEYATYSDGVAAYYKQLFARARAEFPGAHFIVEPYRPYQDWIAQIAGRSDAAQLLPADMLVLQESLGTEFVDDPNIFNAGLGITPDRMGSSSPESQDEYENRLIAAKAGINGAWRDWYNRFGGTGDMPNYSDVSLVPPRLQLIRVVPGWDNLSGTPLSGRFWDGVTYRSPSSYVTPNLISSRQPETGKLFVVFNNGTEGIPLKAGESMISAQCADSLFQENGDCSSQLTSGGGKIQLGAAGLTGAGYIITTTQSSGSPAPPDTTAPSAPAGLTVR